MSLLDGAISLAVGMHRNQKDKGGRPYIFHPLRVMLSMESEKEMIVAVLHDILEDTEVHEELIEDLFGKEILVAVKSVSRNDNEIYVDFIKRAKQNPVGRRVKIQDILDNLRPERLAALEPEIVPGLVRRYERALKILREQN